MDVYSLTTAEVEELYPRFLCLACGHRWTFPVAFTLGDDLWSGPFRSPCPQCGAEAVNLAPPRERIVVDLVQAIRAADLTIDEIGEITRVLQGKRGGDISPRELAERAPRASKLGVIASRVGEQWPILVTAALAAVVSLYAQHQSHADAERALAVAKKAQEVPRTGSLTNQQCAFVVEQVEKARAAAQDRADGRQASKGAEADDRQRDADDSSVSGRGGADDH